MDNIDKETKEIIDTETKIEHFVDSEAWQEIRKMFQEEILDLQSVKNIDMTTDPQKMAIEVMARNHAVTILFTFFQKIEGTAEKSRSQKDVFKKKSFIVER